MAGQQFAEDRIFNIARRLTDAEARHEYLEQVCGDDLALRGRVQTLLEAHSEEGFMESPPGDAALTVDEPVTERPGSAVGRYKLREQVGEGGMGVVFVAEQERPMRRKVAIKIIKPGMDTKEVTARFEAERQALALMDHPHIAKVLDAGTTESGRPYFVMELVRGIPVTEYCDQHKLVIRERLDLFIQVCQAIQHAHQKGIIHRDIKPTNVLVADHDGKPVPKVIDFGVAKATNQRLTERTIYTRLQQMIGTPMYMSPEQAEFSGLDVDTRSDIYSLGVLLYELLTGTPPFDKDRFAKAAYDDIRRIVCEEEPSKPSTKISALGETATTVSAHRATDPRSLSRFVTGDLDVIAMKSIEKDRTRRYDTANALADDVRRFLNDEPIVARSPSLVYRFTKLARRYRVATATSLVVLASLTCGIVATGLALGKARQQTVIANRKTEVAQEANAALAETLLDLKETLFFEGYAKLFAGDIEQAGGIVDRLREMGARDLADKLYGALLVYSAKGPEAVQFLEEKVEEKPSSVGLLALLVFAYADSSNHKSYFSALAKMEALAEPEQAEDYLFAAKTYWSVDPPRGLQYANVAFERWMSPIALLQRGRIKSDYAMNCGDLTYADEAIRDVQAASLFLKAENPYVRIENLATPLLLAYASRASSDDASTGESMWQRYLAEAEPAARAIEQQASKRIWEFYYLAQYYRAVGDGRKELKLFRQVPPDYWTNHFTTFYLARMEALGEKPDDGLVKRIKRGECGALAALGLAYLLALEGKTQESIELMVEWAEESDWVEVALGCTDVYDLCGEPEKAMQLAKKQLEFFQNRKLCTHQGWERDHLLPYRAGRISEEKLRTEAGQSDAKRRWLTYAHWKIAMKYLGEGDVPKAREHLRKCQSQQFMYGVYHPWAEALLRRLENVTAWPPQRASILRHDAQQPSD